MNSEGFDSALDWDFYRLSYSNITGEWRYTRVKRAKSKKPWATLAQLAKRLDFPVFRPDTSIVGGYYREADCTGDCLICVGGGDGPQPHILREGT